MGLILSAAEAAAVVPVRKRAVKRALDPAERGCAACPLQETWPTLGTPQMAMAGPANADVLIMGEGPGEDEDKQGRPFVGVSGELLTKILPRQHADRVAMTNAVRCRPPGNRTPHARELHACSIHLESDVAAGRFKAVLGLGGAPLARFMDEATITAVHGLKFPVRIGDKTLWYYPTLHPAFVLRSGGERSPHLPILQTDITEFFKRVDKWAKPVIEEVSADQVICAYDEDEARGWCDKLWHAGTPIGFDIETTGLRPNQRGAEILTAAASNGKITVAWPVRHPERPNDWGLPLLLAATRNLRWIGHHAGFELGWLYEHSRRAGIAWEPEKGFDDSMVAARLFQRREGCLNLGVLTRLYTGVNIKKLSNLAIARLAEEPLDKVLPYNGLDAWGSWRIFGQLSKYIDQRNYDSILDTVASVTEMQLLGLDVDQDAAQRLHKEWTGRAAAAEAHAKTMYEVRQFEKERQQEFRISSNPNVATALIDYGNVTLPKTARSEAEGGDNYSTDDKVLSALDNPLAADVLEYRHAIKMNSTYVEPILAAPARFVDSRIHPVYSTVLTKTLRTSCEDPNAQNFPKRKDRELRRPVVPPPGCVWASADYGQLEARVYAMATQDPALVRSIIAGEDIHTYWLDVVLRAFPPYMDRLAQKVTPNQTEAQIRKGGRDIIKSDLVFASFFGTTAKNVAERTGIPLEIAAEVLGQFWTRYAVAFAWLKAQRRTYMVSGLTKNLCGVERYGIMLGNEPINTPIQSTAARIVLESQNELHKLYKETGDPHLMPRINIHDDLTFALPEDDAVRQVYIEEISKVLVKVRFGFQIVPLKVEWNVGANWADLKFVSEYTGSTR